jgi:hypothetical protein
VVGSHRGRVQDDRRVLVVLVDSLGELRMQRSGAVMAAAWFSTAMGKMSKGVGVAGSFIGEKSRAGAGLHPQPNQRFI